jgi:tetratricopeptide (TPR) repeat protein
MLRICTTVLYLTLYTVICKASDPDTLSFQSLSFHSEFEKNAFGKSALSTNDRILSLFLAGQSSMNTQNFAKNKAALQSLIQELELKKSQAKTEEKAMKILFTHVHQKLLRKYEEVATLNQIFDSGTYNCVSATALYALVFDQLGIPYSIKEKPTHVYPVAYPNTHRIIVESTSPEQGYFLPTHTFKEHFIKYLVSNKLISQQEYQEKGTEKLFDQYFLSDSGISLEQLAALQYYNHGVQLFMKEDATNACSYLQKAYYLYPSPRVRFVLLQVLTHLLQDTEYKQVKDVEHLAEFANLSKDKEADRHVKRSFHSITYENLVKRNAEKHYDSLYLALHKLLKDSTLRKDVSEVYYFEKARIYHNQEDYRKSLEYAWAGYQINKENTEAQNIIGECVTRLCLRTKDPEESIKLLNEYAKQYGFLLKYPKFIKIFPLLYLSLSEHAFMRNQGHEGMKNLKLFEEINRQNPDLDIDLDLIAKIYAEAGTYYYRQHAFKLAKDYMMKSLKYAPHNSDFKERLAIIEYELKRK